MAKTKNLLFVMIAAVVTMLFFGMPEQSKAQETPEPIPPQEIVKSDVQSNSVQEINAVTNCAPVDFGLTEISEISIASNEFTVQVANDKTFKNQFRQSNQNLYTTENRKLIKTTAYKNLKFPYIKNDSKPDKLNNSGGVKTSKQKATCRSGA